MSDREIKLIADHGKVWASSLHVAEKFQKRHDNVLRAIEGLECSPEFNALNFEEVDYLDPKGERRPCYRMTRQGFSFLAMGFTGKEAAVWKERYIAAFDAMESSLIQYRSDDQKLLLAILDRTQQVSAQLAANVKTLDTSVDEVKDEVRHTTHKINAIETRVVQLENYRSPRKVIKEKVKQQHRCVLAVRNYSCPCCNEVKSNWEFDHFYTNQLPDFRHTWPLCKACHADLTHSIISRMDVTRRFDAYQEFSKAAAKQRDLF